MSNTISIIVPVYNAETFIKRSVESIRNQTYKDLEIILINDGSIDGSAKICDEYKEIDNRIVVIHKKNEGPAKAREVGIKKATGKYISFVDSDDYIEQNFCEVLHSKIEEKCVDWVSSNCSQEILGLKYKNVYIDKIITTSNEFFEDFRNEYIYTRTLWGKLYRSKMIKEYEFKALVVGEDTCFMVDLMKKTQIAYISNYNGYNYAYNENSIIRKKGFNPKLIDSIYAYKYILNDCSNSSCCKYIEKEIQEKLCQMYLNLQLDMDLDIQNKYKKTIINFIKKEKILEGDTSLKKKIHLIGIKYFTPVYDGILRKISEYRKYNTKKHII